MYYPKDNILLYPVADWQEIPECGRYISLAPPPANFGFKPRVFVCTTFVQDCATTPSELQGFLIGGAIETTAPSPLNF
jgi:hypothetical protein